MRRPAELFKIRYGAPDFMAPGPGRGGRATGPGRVRAAPGSLMRRGPSEARCSRHRNELTERFAVQVHEPRQGGRADDHFGVRRRGTGPFDRGLNLLLELCHVDLIGEGNNVVMLAGAFRRPDTNRRSRCARRSDDTEVD